MSLSRSPIGIHRRGGIQEVGRLLHILEPTKAFFFFYLLKRIAAFKPAACPEPDRRQTQGQPFQSHGQARMHENAAYGLSVGFNVAGFATRHSANGTDESGLFALIGKFRGIVQNPHRPLRGAQARACGFEMTPQNVMLVDSIIGKKAIRGLGIGPVLACKWNTASYS